MIYFSTCKTIQLYTSTQAVHVQEMVQMNMDRAKRICWMGFTSPTTCDLLNIACVVGMEQKEFQKLSLPSNQTPALSNQVVTSYTFVRIWENNLLEWPKSYNDNASF